MRGGRYCLVPQLNENYPLQISFQWNGFDITATLYEARGASGEKTVDLVWTGPSSGSATGIIITERLQNETSAESALRHFGAVIV